MRLYHAAGAETERWVGLAHRCNPVYTLIPVQKLGAHLHHVGGAVRAAQRGVRLADRLVRGVGRAAGRHAQPLPAVHHARQLVLHAVRRGGACGWTSSQGYPTLLYSTISYPTLPYRVNLLLWSFGCRAGASRL